ncbi:hypothetical protein LTR94_032242, partial [Friedmanniomyces endolithicus]
MASRNITIDKDYKQFTSLRKVWMEIIWQKSSVAKKYELKPGEIGGPAIYQFQQADNIIPYFWVGVLFLIALIE